MEDLYKIRVLTMNFLISYLCIIYVNSQFFDDENPISINPSLINLGSESLFGHEVKFSKSLKSFYTAAPRAFESATSQREVGAVYICNIDGINLCSERILPYKSSLIGAKIQILPLFGMSFVEISGTKILICAPNMPFIGTNYYCAEYDSSKKLIISTGLFPITRLRNGYSVIDNYGMQVELQVKLSQNDSAFIFSQQNYIHNSVFEPMTSDADLLISGSTRVPKKVIGTRNMPGNKFLVNYFDLNNYLMVPYPDTSFMLGGFDVLSSTFELRQQVNLSYGTIGQQFGFSGAIGLFDGDNCYDVIFSAPFYSEITDQGAIMIYNCDNVTSQFISIPKILLGENIEFARFGMSLLNIGDRNYDKIDDIAVLSTFWYTQNPVLYIFLSTSEGLKDIYHKKITLASSNDFSGNLAYKLIGDFDVDDDGISEIAVTYPMQNRFDYYMGVKLIDINGNLTYIPQDDAENSRYYLDISPNLKLLFTGMIITVNFNIYHLTDKDLLQKPLFKYKISLTGRLNSYFNITGFPDVLNGSFVITEIEKIIKIEVGVIYWFYYIPDQINISVVTEAFIDKNPKECSQKCLKSDIISFTTQIGLDKLLCDDKSCLPKLSLEIEPFNKTLEIGNLNQRRIYIKILYQESAKSYYPQILFTCPDFLKVSNSSFSDSNNLRKNLIINENKTITYIFTGIGLLTPLSNLTFEMNIEIIPSLMDINYELIFSVVDAMYRKPYNDPSVVTLEKSRDPIYISGISSPNIMNILKIDDSGYIEGAELLNYQLQVINGQQYLSLREVYLIVELPLIIENKIFFNYSYSDNTKNLQRINCSVLHFENCSENTIAIYADSIDPNTIIKLSISLLQNQYTEIIAEKEIYSINMNFRVKYSSGGKMVEHKTEITTELRSQKTIPQKYLIYAICVAIFLSLLLIGLLIFLAYKFKIADKIKSHFSKEN